MSGQTNNNSSRPDFDISSVSNEFSETLKDSVSVNNSDLKNNYTIPFAKWTIGKDDASVLNVSEFSTPPTSSTPSPFTIANSSITSMASNSPFESMTSLAGSKSSTSILSTMPTSFPTPATPPITTSSNPVVLKVEPATLSSLKNEEFISPPASISMPKADSNLSNVLASTISMQEVVSSAPTPIIPPVSIDSMPLPAVLDADVNQMADMSLVSDFSSNTNNISIQPITKNTVLESNVMTTLSSVSAPTSSSTLSNPPQPETIKAIDDLYIQEAPTRPVFSKSASPSEASLITGSATSYTASHERPIITHKKPINVFQDDISKIASSTPPEYQIKTLASDISSLKMSGGLESAPQTFIPDSFEGAKLLDMADVSAISASVKKIKLRKTIFIIVGILILIGIGVGGFILSRPLFVPLPQNNIIPPPVVEEPVVIAPLNPTYFVRTPPNNILDIPIETLNIETLRNTLFIQSDPPLVKGFINALNITLEGREITSSEFLSTLLPNITKEQASSVFEDDFTLFVYRDEQNNIPGFIAKVRRESSPELLSQISQLIESSTHIGNLYSGIHNLTPVFEDGIAHNHPIRSALFSDVGYAFNYGWFRNQAGEAYIIAVASYEGIMEAILRAGF